MLRSFGAAVGVGVVPGEGVGVDVGVDVGVGVGVDVGAGVGVGDGAPMIATDCENSDVLPFGSVAVALIVWMPDE